jgi:hypothetical protein
MNHESTLRLSDSADVFESLSFNFMPLKGCLSQPMRDSIGFEALTITDDDNNNRLDGYLKWRTTRDSPPSHDGPAPTSLLAFENRANPRTESVAKLLRCERHFGIIFEAIMHKSFSSPDWI